MASDRDIAEWLGELGFDDPGSLSNARAVLESAGLTNPRKSRISAAKLGLGAELLGERLARVCRDPACRSALAAQRPAAALVTVADRAHCEHCAGSDNLKTLRAFAAQCAARRIRRIVVVGGSPSVRAELEELRPPEWELRLINGTERRTQDRARADLEWAQLVFVWGSSELDHRVSQLYTDPSAHRHKLVNVTRRGVAALLTAGADHLRRLS